MFRRYISILAVVCCTALALGQGAFAALRPMAVSLPGEVLLSLPAGSPGLVKYRFAGPGARWHSPPAPLAPASIPLEVGLAFDATGTMKAAWPALIEGASDLVKTLQDAGFDPALHVLAFGDTPLAAFDCSGPQCAATLQAKLRQIEPQGGGDEPECALDALLQLAVELSARPARRLLVLATDAPFHYRGDGTLFSYTTLKACSDLLEEQGISLWCWAPPAKGYERLAAVTGGKYFDCTSATVQQLLQEVSAALLHETLYRLPLPFRPLEATYYLRLDVGERTWGLALRPVPAWRVAEGTFTVDFAFKKKGERPFRTRLGPSLH